MMVVNYHQKKAAITMEKYKIVNLMGREILFILMVQLMRDHSNKEDSMVLVS